MYAAEGYKHLFLDTGGLVQVSHFSVLPDIGAGAAAAAVLASMIPLLVSVWRRPDPACFACCAALAGLNRCALYWGSGFSGICTAPYKRFLPSCVAS